MLCNVPYSLSMPASGDDAMTWKKVDFMLVFQLPAFSRHVQSVRVSPFREDIDLLHLPCTKSGIGSLTAWRSSVSFLVQYMAMDELSIIADFASIATDLLPILTSSMLICQSRLQYHILEAFDVTKSYPSIIISQHWCFVMTAFEI